MKKTINISIGGMSFQVEEDAYQALENYLNAIKQKFAAYPDAGEIVSDMEDRIAEQFSGKTENNKIITLGLVEELIAVMGRPEQFGEEKTAAEPPKNSFSTDKKFYRNPDDVILAGVCSGIAAYIGTDAVWVRLIFALTIFFGGFGVLLYIILWIILPEAKTDTEKMRMRGEPVNLKNLESMVKERVAELKKKDNSKVKKILAAPFVVIGQILRAIIGVIKKLGPLIVRIIGLAVTLLSAFGLGAIIFAATALIFNINSPYIDFPLRELAHGGTYYAAFASGFFTAFIPALFLLLLGASLMAMRLTLNKLFGFTLLGLWAIAFIIFVNAGIKLAPQIEALTQSSPYYNTVAKQYDLKDFKSIEISGADSVMVYMGNEYKVTATGTQKALELADVKVENGVLKISHNPETKLCIFCSQKNIRYAVYAPSINSLSASGASSINSENITGDSLQISLSGATRANLGLTAKQLTAKLSGASRLELSGNITNATFGLSGASKLYAGQAKITAAKVDTSGASKALVGDLDILEVKADGASTVVYKSAKNLTQDISDAAHLRQDINMDSNYEGQDFYEPSTDKQYTNEIYGFKFNYPADYQMQAGENTQNGFYLPIENYFYQNKKGERIITALLPKDTFPANTDFAGGFISVSAIKNLSQTQCYKFGNQAVANVQKLNINGADFTLADISDAGMGHQAMDKIYHAYNNNICYEIDMGARTSGFGADPNITEQVNKDAVFAKLQPLFQSFEFVK